MATCSQDLPNCFLDYQSPGTPVPGFLCALKPHWRIENAPLGGVKGCSPSERGGIALRGSFSLTVISGKRRSDTLWALYIGMVP